MADKKRICAFYSNGPHYRRLLAFLRERYPDAEITAMTPAGYPADRIANAAERVLTSAEPAYGMGNLRALRALLASIRRERYDMFVVMFDSPRLRFLALAVGARDRFCYTIDGRFSPIRFRPVRMAIATAWRRVRGLATYARIAFIVRHCPVERTGEKPTQR